MEPIISILSGGLVAAGVVLVVKIQKLTPKIEETLDQVENFRKNANDVLGLIENLELLLNKLVTFSQDGKLSDDEATKLLNDAQTILSNPAIAELKKLVDDN